MSLAIIEDHRADLTSLRRLAQSDLQAVINAIRGLDPAGAREVLKLAIPDLLDPFLGAASDAAAVLLEELYVLAGQRPPAIAGSPLLEPTRVDSLARWAVDPLARDDLDSTALSRLTGAATRMIFEASRLTMQNGVARHPSGRRVAFQRMPRADCCAFCGMLASRPAWMAYRSEASAGHVTGRGSIRTGFDAYGNRISGGVGQGVMARGNQAISEKYHDDCRCLSVPLLGGPTSDAIEATRLEFEEKFQQARTDEQGNSHGSTKAILTEWRTLHGAK